MMNKKFVQLLVGVEMLKARKAKGQGVIEYAGALVIAAVLVAAVLTLGPTQINTLFTSILTSVKTYFTGQLPGGS